MRIKLNPVRHLIEGKRVVLIDDSIVRGTTSKKLCSMVREAGAKEIHLRISCPPTISPCYYGIDTPNKADLIAAQMSIDEICKFIEADSLGYLSLGGNDRGDWHQSRSFMCGLLERRSIRRALRMQRRRCGNAITKL